jgi:translation initiation factor 1
MEICPKCGLPIQACMCQEIVKSEQAIKIETVKRKFGKIITIVSGFTGMDIKTTAKELKQKLACGGTIKNNQIELQGDHKARIKKALIEMGFAADSIED